MKLTCSNCDFASCDSEAKFCLKCGTQLINIHKPNPKPILNDQATNSITNEVNNTKPPSDSESEKYKCMECGAAISPHDLTCQFCGAKVSMAKTPKTYRTTNRFDSSPGLLFKAILILGIPFAILLSVLVSEQSIGLTSDNIKHIDSDFAEFDKLIEQGDQLTKDGKHSEAILKFNEALDMGNLIDENRLTVAAQKITDVNLKLAPELLSEAKALYSEQLYIDAYNSLQSALDYNPNLAEASTLLPEYEKQKTALEAKEHQEAEKIAKQQAKEKMKDYEFGSGPVGVAVTEVKTTKTAGDYYFKDSSHHFVWLYINTSNEGTSSTHINPNYFTLAVPGGYASNYDKATFSLSNYLDAKDIPPNTFTSGWLIFGLPKAEKYELHYKSIDSEVIKTIYP